MAVAPSAVERAVLDSLMRLAEKANKRLDRSTVTNLLLWWQWKGLVIETTQMYLVGTWEKIGKELWEQVQTGSPEAKQLAQA